MKFVESITNEFVEAFDTDADFHGAFAKVVSTGELPYGVDPKDSRVIEIVRRCKEANKAST